jgi:hypothetical protein
MAANKPNTVVRRGAALRYRHIILNHRRFVGCRTPSAERPLEQIQNDQAVAR